jgi:signal transduction histidine kinase
VRALVALTTLLVGVAAVVAYAVARDADRDVDFIARRVRDMVQVRTEPTGEPVPVRTMDEIGALTSAFNQLVGRFGAAEKKYHDDLERVRTADRDRAAFLAAVSHELRSPLNAILGFADILMTEVDGPLSASAREEVEQIRGSGQHLLDLINDILEFSAIESGQLKLSRTKVDLSALATEVAREASGALHGRPIALRLEGTPGVMGHVDAKRVRQVLTNLVANAMKFTVEGEVVITVTREGRYAKVSVRDTGPGINAAERAVIFEEYKQTKEERRKKRGTGLGLAIARRIVLMHAGTIAVESELGRGSTFKVSLPAWNEPSPSQRPAPWSAR